MHLHPPTSTSPTDTFTCQTCKKEFKKADALRRHKHTHASHKPVLVCPRSDCQAYFSTTFNLQHHIRKVHLDLLKYKCSFPDCPRMFAMRVSENEAPKLMVSSWELHVHAAYCSSDAGQRLQIVFYNYGLCVCFLLASFLQESMTRHLLRHDIDSTTLRVSLQSESCYVVVR